MRELDYLAKSIADKYCEQFSKEEQEKWKDLDFFKKEFLREMDEQLIRLINYEKGKVVV